MKSTIKTSVVFLMLISMISCGSIYKKAYYGFWEKLGKEKRHILKDNVKKARDEQQKASQEFEDVVTKIKSMYGFDGGDLEKFYNKLKSDQEDCQERAQKVRERIENVQTVAGDLFKEWQGEIDQITNPKFKAQSKKSLKMAQARYKKLEKAMLKSRDKMEPVLVKLNDYVLYLKHNLNAQAIGALKNEVNGIESEVNKLVKDMRKSITEADEFIKTFES